MKLKVIRPFNDMGTWKKPGDTIQAEGWRASKLLQSGCVTRDLPRETASLVVPEKAVTVATRETPVTVPEVPAGEAGAGEDYPVHLGGGYYLLPCGQKVRGKKEALEAMGDGCECDGGDIGEDW